MASGVIIGMIGCVGNGDGDGTMIIAMNVDVGAGVGETTVGIGISVGRMTACFSQADSVTSRITTNKGFI